MPTIDDILNRVGITQSSSADLEMEKQAEALGLIDNEDNLKEGDTMNLKDFYENHFGDGLQKQASTQVAVVDEGLTKIAETQIAMGEYARDVFDSMLEDRLTRFNIIKQAMAEEGSPDSAATQAAAQGPGVIPSGLPGDPRLPVNRPADASAAMDTAPVFYDLGPSMDKAVEKARLEQAIAQGNTDESDVRGVSNTASGMAMPAAQGM